MQELEIPNIVDESPAKSVVQVYFHAKNTRLAYFNDLFDLHVGDIVYVEGKLEGLRGEVVEVTHDFKIKVSEYKRVIGKADTAVMGTLYMAGSHFVAFSPDVIPFEKVLTWYKAPEKEGDEYVTGNGEMSFSLDDLSGMNIRGEIAERGRGYYLQNKVRYISVDGIHGRAIVEGSMAYTVDFTYEDGQIRNLVSDCFCSYTCKHEIAAMLQLRETLEIIEENYSDRMNGYFAAISKSDFFGFAVDGKRVGSLSLGDA